ncbi:hypothetical protein BDZ85DRAFT_310533 [Elsinoe ampelina]|uniref:Uncharacterized protein n=1 Tax=Elsinoe ampelina TaxID=302913 RepID=A0A6A6GFM0_9PEZI|nr:hypothetical protein BDZ85DRAFT_310533 [Elsinoe ampelina]
MAKLASGMAYRTSEMFAYYELGGCAALYRLSDSFLYDRGEPVNVRFFIENLPTDYVYLLALLHTLSSRNTFDQNATNQEVHAPVSRIIFNRLYQPQRRWTPDGTIGLRYFGEKNLHSSLVPLLRHPESVVLAVRNLYPLVTLVFAKSVSGGERNVVAFSFRSSEVFSQTATILQLLEQPRKRSGAFYGLRRQMLAQAAVLLMFSFPLEKHLESEAMDTTLAMEPQLLGLDVESAAMSSIDVDHARALISLADYKTSQARLALLNKVAAKPTSEATEIRLRLRLALAAHLARNGDFEASNNKIDEQVESGDSTIGSVLRHTISRRLATLKASNLIALGDISVADHVLGEIGFPELPLPMEMASVLECHVLSARINLDKKDVEAAQQDTLPRAICCIADILRLRGQAAAWCRLLNEVQLQKRSCSLSAVLINSAMLRCLMDCGKVEAIRQQIDHVILLASFLDVEEYASSGVVMQLEDARKRISSSAVVQDPE